MTKREAAIVSAYTGYLCGDYADFLEYVQTLYGRPFLIHELSDVLDQINSRAKEDFLSIKVKEDIDDRNAWYPEAKTLYLCDRMACGGNCPNPECMHTADVTHAKNFELIGGAFFEK